MNVTVTMTMTQYEAMRSLIYTAGYFAKEAESRRSWPNRVRDDARILGRLAGELAEYRAARTIEERSE
jgi:hypothetical protein